MGNHDHIYIAPPAFDLIDFASNVFEKANPDSIYLSHFPELLARLGKYPFINQPSRRIKTEISDRVIEWKNIDSVQIFRRGILSNFWKLQGKSIDAEYGGFVRTDDPRFSLKIKLKYIKTYIPEVEILRHFDGYDHANLQGYQLDADFIDRFYRYAVGNDEIERYKLFTFKGSLDKSIHRYQTENPRYIDRSSMRLSRICKATYLFLFVDLFHWLRLRLK
jgi:hypothetical protein